MYLVVSLVYHVLLFSEKPASPCQCFLPILADVWSREQSVELQFAVLREHFVVFSPAVRAFIFLFLLHGACNKKSLEPTLTTVFPILAVAVNSL